MPIRVEVLSLGRGVSQDALRAYEDIKAFARQTSEASDGIDISELLLGLEGERRLCISTSDRSSADALAKEIAARAEGIELLSVTRSECDAGPNP